jgi:hypothetical protein
MQTWAREEVESLTKHGTWVLENLPSGRRTVKSKWVLKLKHFVNGQLCRSKLF